MIYCIKWTYTVFPFLLQVRKARSKNVGVRLGGKSHNVSSVNVGFTITMLYSCLFLFFTLLYSCFLLSLGYSIIKD